MSAPAAPNEDLTVLGEAHRGEPPAAADVQGLEGLAAVKKVPDSDIRYVDAIVEVDVQEAVLRFRV